MGNMNRCIRMPSVYNKHSYVPKGAVYIGRGSPYGNPFKIDSNNTRTAVIKKYREWIFAPAQKELFDLVRKELKGKDLVCYCAPKACHGDILLEIANNEHPILDELTRLSQENGEYD